MIDAMGSGTLLMGGIFALIVALASVGVMKGKLHQAARQSAAANYLVDGSFALDVAPLPEIDTIWRNIQTG